VAHPLIGERCFQTFVIKPFINELLAIPPTENLQESFNSIEKKALRKYLLFLLSKQDYPSKKLVIKAVAQGFKQEVIDELISTFQTKGWIDDKAYLNNRALKKIKQGYALTSVKGVADLQLAQNLEQTALINLINKKKNLLLSNNLKDKQKGYRFFLSRGYSITQVKEQLACLEPDL
jgi:SOS response regulatory protein OraA/RecX